MIMFLRINGLKMAASDDEIFEKIAAVANRRIDKHQLAEWLSSATASIQQRMVYSFFATHIWIY